MKKNCAPRPKIVVILGPTASGKSELGIFLAKKFNGEIISADSRQVYRGMDIGTGKITKKEMRGVPHHLLDIASPRRTFTVAQYQKLGKAAIQKILSKGKLPIVVGGTGFYIDALIYDYHLPHVKANPKLRRELDKKSAEELFRKLKTLDPRRAKTIDRHNKRRLVRALEILLATKKPVPAANESLRRESKYEILKFGTKINPEKLKEKIGRRLVSRLKQGMIAEIKKLRGQGIGWKRLDSFGLEYRFVSRYLRGFIDKEEMIKLLEKEIWHYAKRQMTWFKRDKDIKWVTSRGKIENLVKKFLGLPAVSKKHRQEPISKYHESRFVVF